ncbi:MAG: hypothetical protein U9M90_01675 [Patescibacteria group bacterium]|nr:hypothetical protein [Patescibacteria group bacterium]
MKKIKKIKKIVFAVMLGFIITQSIPVLALTPISIDVGDIGVGGLTDEFAEELENRYGYDRNIIRRSKKKAVAPTVEIHFDKTDPEEGEKVTAIASVKGFKNVTEDLYYTWYVLRTDSATGTPLAGETIAGAKERAMGIIARGEYDPELFGETYATDTDNDGFYASYGGQDGVGAKEGDGVGIYDDDPAVLADPDKQIVDTAAITRCYRHNFGIKVYDPADNAGANTRAGRDLIIECEHEFPSCSGHELGDGSFGLAEEECWRLDPNNPDTDGDGVEDEADLVGLNQNQFTWKYLDGDHVGVIVEGMSLSQIVEPGLNAYHKIMWAMPDICARKDESRTFISGDHCSPGEGDVGFGYLAAVPVNSISDQQLDPELDYIPKNPQFDDTTAILEEQRTDLVTVSSTMSNDNVDEDFIFYSWTIRRTDDHLEPFGPPLGAGDIEFESFEQGMGVKHLKFKPMGGLFGGDDKVFLFVTLIVSEHPELIGGSDVDARNLPIGAIESIIIPVARKDLALRIFNTTIVPGPGLSGNAWAQNVEICGAGGNPLYRDVCPVFGYQVIAVEANVLGGINAGDRFAWQFNGRPVQPPFDLDAYPGANNSNSNIIFLPMGGTGSSLQDITVTYKKNRGGVLTDIIAGRKISVNNPVAVIEAITGPGGSLSVSAVNGGNPATEAIPTIRWDQTESLDIFEADPGTQVNFRARIVPDYLTINAAATLIEDLEGDPANPGDDIILADNEVHLMWYLNGSFVDADFIADYPTMGITVAGDEIEFTMDPEGMYGSGFDLTARVEKKFSPDHAALLDDAWKMLDTHTLTNDKSVTIRLHCDSPFALGPNPTLREYLASSLANAPHYLIFSIRLAVAMALVWFVLFGFSYAIQLNKRL